MWIFCSFFAAKAEKMKQTKEKIAYYIVLAASFVLLLSVVIPHHHHSNGLPCFEWIMGEAADTHSHHHVDDTGCTDHNQALNLTIDKHVFEHDMTLVLTPLLTLFNYSDTEDTLFLLLFNREAAIYKETLHDTWIGKAKGLRAPPVC